MRAPAVWSAGGRMFSGAGHACDVCAHTGKKVVATVSAPGEFGHGAFKNEPWGLQSYEKRVYAVREFYKATLRGETADNPADDERVKGMLSSIVRVVGKKGRHVPEVRAR